MTKLEAAKAIGVLVCAYPSVRWTEENSKVYESLLSDLEFDELRFAIERLCSTSKFMPTIAEIRAAVLEGRDGGPRTAEDAWGDVVQAVRHVGSYRPAPKFDDPLVAFVVDRMGWRELCQTSNSAADRARFCELYDKERDRARKQTIASPGLVGGTSAQALPRPMRELAARIGRAPR